MRLPPSRISSRGARTRERMLDAAADLFHARGVHATSPGDVLAASSTGKGQFYHYFGSKEGLVCAVLQRYAAQIRAGTAPLSFELNTLGDLERWFREQVALQRQYAMSRGCPFGTIGGELTAEEELTRLALADVFAAMRERVLAFFEARQREGRLQLPATPESLADLCLAAMQGALLLGKVERDSTPAERTVAHVMRYLRSLVDGP